MSFMKEFNEMKNRKKHKIDPNAATICQLPEHILIEIFDFLPKRDLLATTLVCKDFNDIVSNSARLLAKFEINFSRFSLRKPWTGARRYTRLAVAPQTFNHFLPTIESIIDDITSLSIGTIFSLAPADKSPNAGDLKRLLLKARNLRHLKIEFRRLEEKISKSGGDGDGEEKLELSLDSLKVIGGDEFVAMFADCQTRRFAFTTFNYSISSELKDFFMRQRRLEDLDIRSVLGGLFADAALARAPFRLRTLRFGKIPEPEVANFLAFVAQHEPTLEHVETDDFNEKVLAALAKFSRLRSMTLHNGLQTIADDDLRFEHVRRLTISMNFNESWARRFPNLTHLSVFAPRECSGFELLKGLRTLAISRATDCPHIDIPQVRKLTLECLKHQTCARPFDFATQQLEELHVVGKREDEEGWRWVEEFKAGGFVERLKIFTEVVEA